MSTFADRACADVPGFDAIFYPPEGQHAAAAKAICATCPECVQVACLRMALDVEGNRSRNGRYGVFGGKTPAERAAIARGRR